MALLAKRFDAYRLAFPNRMQDFKSFGAPHVLQHSSQGNEAPSGTLRRHRLLGAFARQCT